MVAGVEENTIGAKSHPFICIVSHLFELDPMTCFQMRGLYTEPGHPDEARLPAGTHHWPFPTGRAIVGLDHDRDVVDTIIIGCYR